MLAENMSAAASTPDASPALAGDGITSDTSSSARPTQGTGLTCGVEDCQWCAGRGQIRCGGVWSDCYDCNGRGLVCSTCTGIICADDYWCTRCNTVAAERVEVAL